MTDAPMVQRLNAALEDRYRIERELGEGGMATVYLARDFRHERRVAIKVLRPELAAVIGAERFLAEIKTTANLQHPHILPLFDSGEADGFLYYVMPYIEGESLRDRLEREGQLGVEDAVRIARDVADALDYAHRSEIIHRDIKPANILLNDGRPLVSDFGIALAVSAAGGGRMTETGLSLGTPHYMSPEQASAERDLSPRSDVYSLGCVLFEMLAGQPPHTGPNAQSVLVRILTEDPRDVSELRRTVPPHVAATVMKAIEKLPADRFASARDFKDALDDPGFTHTVMPRAATAAGRGAGAARPGQAGAGSWLSDTHSRVAVGALALLAVALGLSIFDRGADTSTALGDPPVRTLLDLGDLSTSTPQYYWVIVSPDGSRFAVVRDGGERWNQVFHRTASDMEFRPLPGTEGQIINMAFSPDGEGITYATSGGLMRVSLLGGQPTQLLAADSIHPFLVDWGSEGWIAFWTLDEHVIYRIPDTGGPVERLVGPPEWNADGQPSLLPDGSGLLFHDPQRGIALYDFEADSARVLLPDGIDPTYVHSGHLVYADGGGGLWAAPFDLDAHEVTGDPKPVLQGVMSSFRVAGFSISRNGTLVYTRGPSAGYGGASRIVTVELDGTETVLNLAPRPAAGLRWAPDGRRIAFQGGEPGGDWSSSDIYVYDTEVGNAPTRLTNRGDNFRPVFSPDGSRIAFSSVREGTDGADLFIRELNDDAPPSKLISLPGDQFPADWPTDSLIVMDGEGTISTVTLGGDTATYYAPDAWVSLLRVAPGGTLAAYESDESGEDEVYIRAFPDPRAETLVSSNSGWSRAPWWSEDGRTLYYVTPDSIWAARIGGEPTPTVLSRRPLFAESGERFFQDFRDGRFLATSQWTDEGENSAEDDEPIRYVVVHDWFTELERIFEDGR